MKTRLLPPVTGDLLALAVVTWIGFATHGETDLAFLPRMAAAFFPLTLSWFLLAPWFGIFDSETIRDPRQLWRPALAMVFAAPLAAVVRGLILNAPILPIFALVLGGTSAAGMLIWRGIFLLLNRANRLRPQA